MGENTETFEGSIIRSAVAHDDGRIDERFSIYYDSGEIVNINSRGTVYLQDGNTAKTFTNCFLDRDGVLDALRAIEHSEQVTFDDVNTIIRNAVGSCQSVRSRY